jgi:hypothetical protein
VDKVLLGDENQEQEDKADDEFWADYLHDALEFSLTTDSDGKASKRLFLHGIGPSNTMNDVILEAYGQETHHICSGETIVEDKGDHTYALADVEGITVVKIDLAVANDIRELMQTNTFEVMIDPNFLTASAYQMEIRRAADAVWHQLGTHKRLENFVQRVAGTFRLRGKATVLGKEFVSDEKDMEVQFPDAATIAADATVDAARAADWTAASGAGGDHNERGGYIYLNTTGAGTYRVDPWPIGTFFGVAPAGAPDADGISANLVDAVNSYYVGEYHLHATLRNAADVANAANFPTGPSPGDIDAANAAGAPGLLRDRHTDEIVETGHIDFTYGPDRRATP